MNKNQPKGIKILSLEAKDIAIGAIINEENGFSPRYASGNLEGCYNLKKFINTLDYSLESIKLRDVYKKKYRNNHFTWHQNGHDYTTSIINVTFRYTLNLYNKVSKYVLVHYEYNFSAIKECFDDHVVIIDNKLVAIELNTHVNNPVDKKILDKCFFYDTDTSTYQMKTIPTIKTTMQLRHELYKDGFLCDGTHYVRFKRSSGSSRVGKCLFIDEKLYPMMHRWEKCGLDIKNGQDIDLAAFEAYISLTTSSIIDTITIRPENILLIDDYTSVFNDEVIETRLNEQNKLETKECKAKIANSIWDGQSLMDVSLFENYKDKGMLLLRNQFFKSCCFNTNIQQWFKDHNITSIHQLNGITKATDIKDILLITTPNSIKYLKFGTFEQWLNNINPVFGIVKYDKPTNYINGTCVQTHYQLLNTLSLTKQEMTKLLEPTFQFMRSLKNSPDILRYYIKYPFSRFDSDHYPALDKNQVFYKMLSVSNKFKDTKLYKDFLSETLKSFTKNMRKGHILVQGNYSTLCGNPIEMLQQAIGTFNGESIIGINFFSTTRFAYNTEIMAIRSPHVVAGCVLVHKNKEIPLIDKYMNRTDEIIYINAINENILMQLAGADFDSDTVLITNNDILINAYKQTAGCFKVPTSSISSIKRKRSYTSAEQCDLDIKTSGNYIGEIINLSQELNTLYWHEYNNNADSEKLKEIYADACQLSIMSGIEIDRAKKEFTFSNRNELKKIRDKYMRKDKDRNIKPYFFSFIHKYKGYYDNEKNIYMHHDTPMDYLEELINKERMSNRFSSQDKIIKFAECLKPKITSGRINYDQVEKTIELIKDYQTKLNSIFSNPDSSKECKYDLYHDLYSSLTSSISKIRYNIHTIYYILRLLDRPQYISIYRTLFKIIFSLPNSSFYNCIEETKEDLYEFIPSPEGNYCFYGTKFKKKKHII